MTSSTVYIEVRRMSLQLLLGEHGEEIPLERQENGRLAPTCRDRLGSSIRTFLQQHGMRGRCKAVCGIAARGVAVRQLTLPNASRDDTQRLLLLQIEREFPLSPGELAWGRYETNGTPKPANGSVKTQEVVVGAVKRDVILDIKDVLSGCGLDVTFTLAALGRACAIPNAPGSFAVLDLGGAESELLVIREGGSPVIRTIGWGTDVIRSPQEAHVAAGESRTGIAEESGVGRTHLADHTSALAKALPLAQLGRTLFVTGNGSWPRLVAPELARLLGSETHCDAAEVESGPGRSAATIGLKRLYEERGADAPLVFDAAPVLAKEKPSRPVAWNWAMLAVALAVCSVALRYGETIIQKPRLAREIAAIKAYRDKLPDVERELSFLQYLKSNQPPYLEPIVAMADSAASGTRIESLSMTRRGEFSLRASVRDAQQIGDFRSKLMNSGLFSSLSVDEQTASADRQKIIVRLTGQWKPYAERKGVSQNAPDPAGSRTTAKPARPAVPQTNATPAVPAAASKPPEATPSTVPEP